MSQITTHVLDTALGKPASGIKITLYKPQGKLWEAVCEGITNEDGRVPGFFPKDTLLAPGKYKMVFATHEYFNALGVTAFYPEVTVLFETTDTSHYHIPLLLSPFGYSTYRGS